MQPQTIGKWYRLVAIVNEKTTRHSAKNKSKPRDRKKKSKQQPLSNQCSHTNGSHLIIVKCVQQTLHEQKIINRHSKCSQKMRFTIEIVLFFTEY